MKRASFALLILILSGCATMQGDQRVLQAVANQDLARLRELISRGAELNPDCGYYRICQPLSIAAECGYLGVMQVLIDGGADIDGRSSYGDTPLIFAMMAKKREAAILLVDRGADVNKPNDFGVSPFIGACAYGDLELIQYFLKHGADINASFKNNTTAKKVPDNMTALMYAVDYGEIETVKFLITMGADVHAVDSSGMTALEYAQKNGNKAIIDLLKSKKQ